MKYNVKIHLNKKTTSKEDVVYHNAVDSVKLIDDYLVLKRAYVDPDMPTGMCIPMANILQYLVFELPQHK